MLKLYYSPGACSIATHYFLEKFGVAYQAIPVDLKQKSQAFLAINPEGTVPVLVYGALALSQNIAIIDYLEECFPEKLILGSKDVQEKAVVRKWLAFLNSNLHPKFYPLFNVQRFVQSDSAAREIQTQSREDLVNLYQKIEQRLSESPWLGANFSIADVYLFATVRWALAMKIINFSQLPHLGAVFDQILNDDIMKKVMTDEGLIK